MVMHFENDILFVFELATGLLKIKKHNAIESRKIKSKFYKKSLLKKIL